MGTERASGQNSNADSEKNFMNTPLRKIPKPIQNLFQIETLQFRLVSILTQTKVIKDPISGHRNNVSDSSVLNEVL